MALGASGPPASAKQVQYLEALLDKAGYASFREARHPLGLTQRQSNGKFSKSEASELIDQLVNGEAPSVDEAYSKHTAPDSAADAVADKILAGQATVLKGIPAQLLADELLSRGWSVREPS
ncbi:MAG: hypothetical protein F2681_01370 [Actinobacteria bacterium]|uniref:Unannotated protein n=1 Tax=freshwater metagenome TaxID=449393 RepID=A0A6J7C731_9ZZZZ|nr:hypothetical protein [Actinomycetota bacterium]MSW76065.1 hypothetical protein [Actinomycetota bacterium]MSX55447.1 hypothetical protein [Actinomycetota bacterium]MSZ81775.1 hypothetical protein [Actinomycetota bacterium]MTB16614.1 hypothetical protein [Actinomycetota bacterium]